MDGRRAQRTRRRHRGFRVTTEARHASRRRPSSFGSGTRVMFYHLKVINQRAWLPAQQQFVHFNLKGFIGENEAVHFQLQISAVNFRHLLCCPSGVGWAGFCTCYNETPHPNSIYLVLGYAIGFGFCAESVVQKVDRIIDLLCKGAGAGKIAESFPTNTDGSCLKMRAPNIKRAQAVARAESHRGEIAEPGDQDDRRSRGIGQQQAEKARAERQRSARRAQRPQTRAPKSARRRQAAIISPTAINVPSA